MNDRQHQHQKYIEYNLENPSITHVPFSTLFLLIHGMMLQIGSYR